MSIEEQVRPPAEAQLQWLEPLTMLPPSPFPDGANCQDCCSAAGAPAHAAFSCHAEHAALRPCPC